MMIIIKVIIIYIIYIIMLDLSALKCTCRSKHSHHIVLHNCCRGQQKIRTAVVPLGEQGFKVYDLIRIVLD